MTQAGDAIGEPARERIALDVHAHVIPLRRADAARSPGIAWNADGALVVDGAAMTTMALYDAGKLVAWMDRQNVARAWISIPPTLYRLALAGEEAHRWSAIVNKGLAAMAGACPDRLAPMFHLPAQAPAAAVAVAEAAIAGGVRRFAMSAGSPSHGLTYSDAVYVPLWQALDRARAFLFLHPNRGCDPRYDRFHLHNLLGGPTETALAAAHLAMSGVLERHPRVTVCLAHGGGATAAVAGRLAHGNESGRTGALGATEPLGRALRRLCVDCITHSAPALRLAAETHGEDRVLFGSDWPFAMGLAEPHRQLAALAPGLRTRIFADNPLALEAALALEAGDPPDGAPGER